MLNARKLCNILTPTLIVHNEERDARKEGTYDTYDIIFHYRLASLLRLESSINFFTQSYNEH